MTVSFRKKSNISGCDKHCLLFLELFKGSTLERESKKRGINAQARDGKGEWKLNDQSAPMRPLFSYQLSSDKQHTQMFIDSRDQYAK